MGKKSDDHRIVLLDYRHVECSCGWQRELREGDWGVAAGYDRLLDLHARHRELKDTEN